MEHTMIPKSISAICAFAVCFLCISGAIAQTVDPALQGYCVIARKETRGDICRSSDWTDLPMVEMESLPQMRITGREVLYYQGSVRCEVVRIAPSKTPTFVGGAAKSNAANVDLRCFDEGTVGRHSVTWRMMNVGEESLLIKSRRSWTPELWVKCTAK